MLPHYVLIWKKKLNYSNYIESFQTSNSRGSKLLNFNERPLKWNEEINVVFKMKIWTWSIAHGQPVTELEKPKHRIEVNGVNEKRRRNICFTHPPPQLKRIELKDVKEIRSTHIIRIYYAM